MTASRSSLITDIHTHLFPPSHTSFFKHGIEELLTYHYLVSEYLTRTGVEPAHFFQKPTDHQAADIWKTLFVENLPISEACQGVLSVLKQLRVNPHVTDFNVLKKKYPALRPLEWEKLIFKATRVGTVTMTNNPFDEAEWALFASSDWDRDRYRASIRMDDFFFNRAAADRVLQKHPAIRARADWKPVDQFRAFLSDACRISQPAYAALSLTSVQLSQLMQQDEFVKGLMPALADYQLPLALMIGVERRIQPAYGSGGDGIKTVSLEPLKQLLQMYPQQRILVTTLDRNSQHELAVLGRLFSRLTLFGCWWYVNTPSLVSETLTLRHELLGMNFIPQHSDARICEQLIYKWGHFQSELDATLSKNYARLRARGFSVSAAGKQRDRNDLLHANAQRVMRSRESAS